MNELAASDTPKGSRRAVFNDDFDFVFVYWHLILVTPDGPRFRSTFLPRLPLAMVVLF